VLYVCISFCVCIGVSACVFVLFPLFDLSFVASFSTLILLVGLLTCKNSLPYNLYCVGGDVKHCTIQSNPSELGRRLAVGRFRWQVRQSGMHYRTV